jgi:hypothetical protein
MGHFKSQKWYIPQYDDVSKYLTEIEKKNVRLIKDVEKQK